MVKIHCMLLCSFHNKGNLGIAKKITFLRNKTFNLIFISRNKFRLYTKKALMYSISINEMKVMESFRLQIDMESLF